MIDNSTVSAVEKAKDRDQLEEITGNVSSESKTIDDIIEYLTSQPNISFKSQQIGEEELTITEKRNIAKLMYSKSAFLFLTKFGSYLNDKHLDFFEHEFINDYDISYLTKQFKILLIDEKRKIITKNRRYEALLKMLNNDTYFSETEMMKRNPLLYDQLVGKYLSEQEKITRDNIDIKNITLLNVLMEGMDKQIIKDTLEKQKCQEECQLEESEEEDEHSTKHSDKYNQWGEFSDRTPTSFNRKENDDESLITATERSLLREEFVQEMYRSFLAGEDEGINYNEIDNNTEYDSVEVGGRDEEEKYFDSETPEETMDHTSYLSENAKENLNNDVESEDELDVYMKHLNNHPSLGIQSTD